MEGGFQSTTQDIALSVSYIIAATVLVVHIIGWTLETTQKSNRSSAFLHACSFVLIAIQYYFLCQAATLQDYRRSVL